MALSNSSIIAILARYNSQFWETVGGGPGGGIDRVDLNPQSSPPQVGYGVRVGIELVRAAGTAQLLRVAFDPDVDGICPPPRTRPPIPWPPAPYPWRPGDGPDPEWIAGYAAGLAFALEASADSWQHLDGADALTRIHEVAVATAQRGLSRSGQVQP